MKDDMSMPDAVFMVTDDVSEGLESSDLQTQGAFCYSCHLNGEKKIENENSSVCHKIGFKIPEHGLRLQISVLRSRGIPPLEQKKIFSDLCYKKSKKE